VNSLLYSKEFESLSVSDVKNSKVTFYPNPVKDILNIQTTSKIYGLSIYNFAGQQVFSKANVQDGKIDVSNLLSGIYIVKAVFADGESQSFKMIKR
jgi:hypothetical protein